MLDVPHHVQLEDGYCFPACVQMVLAYFDVHRDQRELARTMGVIAKIGVPTSRISRLAVPQIVSSHQQGDVADLIAALQRGTPPILNVDTAYLPHWNESTAHAVVLIGLSDDQRTAIIHDPGFAQPGITCNADRLWTAWDDGLNFFTLIARH